MIVGPARAKLNLALHVRARRPDGYHEIETLFAFVDYGDEVRVFAASQLSLAVSGPFAGALAGEGDNLVLRAAQAFAGRYGTGGAAIELVKNLPVASGIGGGSADAAATLRALARLHDVSDRDGLFAIAEGLGSDVPACLLGETAIGRGRGEQLEPVAGAPGTPVLLVNPGVAVATGPVFAGWDGVDRGGMPQGTLLDIARQGRNDLQPPAVAIVPVIGEVQELLDALPGALLARMSGSGATCFALFASGEARDLAADAVRAARPNWWCVATALA